MSKFTAFLPMLLLVACGGSTPPAEAPKPPESKSEAPAAKASSDEKADTESASPDKKADAKSSDAKKEEPKPDDSQKPTRSLQDTLTASDVVFMLSFKDSDIKQAAETKCSATSSNDPKKMNACMAEARKAVDVDGYRFKEVDGKWWWSTLRTQGRVLHTTHKFEIEFGPEQDKSITIKPKGKDMGTAHGRTPGSFSIEVPNEYQITINDPKLGKLVYEAKIGTASE